MLMTFGNSIELRQWLVRSYLVVVVGLTLLLGVYSQLRRTRIKSGAIQIGVDEADSQLLQSDIPNYWTYAQKFTIADKFFSAVAGPTFPNHLFTIAGEDANVDTIPKTGSNVPWGCDTPAGITVEQRFPDGSTKHVAPCFDFPTLADVLDPAGISWKYYVYPGSFLDTYDAIKHIRYGPDWNTHRSNWTNFISDASSGNLPAEASLMKFVQF